MSMSSRMVHELHCDAVGCGSLIEGPDANQVLRQAMEIQNWKFLTMTTSPGHVKIVYFCPLHQDA